MSSAVALKHGGSWDGAILKQVSRWTLVLRSIEDLLKPCSPAHQFGVDALFEA